MGIIHFSSVVEEGSVIRTTSMAPSFQSTVYQNPGSPSAIQNGSQVETGSHRLDLPSFFTAQNLERHFTNEKLQEIFDAIVEESAKGMFLPLLLLTKWDTSRYLSFMQHLEEKWHDPELVPEALKAKIRRTVSWFIATQLFDAYPAMDTGVVGVETRRAKPSGGIADTGINWETNDDIVDVLSLMGRNLTKEGFINTFAFKVWLPPVLLSEGITSPSEISHFDYLEAQLIWEKTELPERKRLVLEFAERKIHQILNLPRDVESSSLDGTQETRASLDSVSMLDENLDGKEAEEVLHRELMEGADGRKNESYHYLVKWRGQEANNWVSYETVKNTDAFRAFNRKVRFAAGRKKTSPKRLNKTKRH